MEVNVFLISNPGDFDKEKKLLSLNVFEPLKKEIKGVSLNFFDLVEIYDKTDKESVAKKASKNSLRSFAFTRVFQFLQKLRESNVISEKSSTLPRIIISIRTHLETKGKATYEPPGPT